MSAVLCLAACPEGDDSQATDGSTTASLETLNLTSTTASVTGDAVPTGGAATSGSGTTGEDATGTAGSTAADPTAGTVPMPVACDGKIWECGDGIDNDGDGAIDGGDLECTSPCDNKEHSLQTSLPGQAKDCKNDCYWDAESGVGNDGCEYALPCDAQDPGAQLGCEFVEVCEPKITAECLDVCVPLVPNGCDCFGCCHIDTPDGIRDIYLGSSDACSLTNLDACEQCTFQDGCQNPCDEDNCEVCFGELEPPEGCGPPTCDPGIEPCMVDQNGVHGCDPGFYCATGCCYPIEPG